MSHSNPEGTAQFIVTMERKRIAEQLAALVTEANQLVERGTDNLMPHHLQSAEATLADLRFRLTKIDGIAGVFPSVRP